jgi:glutamate formiminotransferase/formiminotetrahydrofolate cyclodeaminase
MADRPPQEELMTAPLVECVPNFSEGRDRPTIDALRSAIAGVAGVQLLDVQSDAAHHRSVFTFVAPPAAAVDAAFAAMRVATQRIDLTRHSGEHPRMGATDVVPFVPVAGLTMDECVALARTLGERVGKELEIPVFLYARAATRPERVLLPDVRKGEFEGMRDRTLEPDFGPNRVHPTAGATAIGARPFLVAYNVYLDTPDVSIAKDIAKQIRTSSGGLPAVQASGFEVKGHAQVSMNLLDIDITPPQTVFGAIKALAAKRGVEVKKSEIVGLIPERAIISAAGASLQLPDAADHILEAKIRAAQGPTLDGWIDELASGTPAPGGGSAAALAGALAAGLVAMVARLTIGKKAYASVESEMQQILRDAEECRAELRELIDADSEAYQGVMRAYGIPKAEPGRQRKIDEGLVAAAETPFAVARAAFAVRVFARALQTSGNKNARTDAAVAEQLATAAIGGALANVRINLESLSDQQLGKTLREEMTKWEGEA